MLAETQAQRTPPQSDERPRPKLRESIRQRCPDRAAPIAWIGPPVDPNRGLFDAIDGVNPAGEREIVDLVYRALSRDQELASYLRRRGVDLDRVWSLVRAVS